MDVLEIGELLVEMTRQQQRGIGEVAFGNLMARSRYCRAR